MMPGPAQPIFVPSSDFDVAVGADERNSVKAISAPRTANAVMWDLTRD